MPPEHPYSLHLKNFRPLPSDPTVRLTDEQLRAFWGGDIRGALREILSLAQSERIRDEAPPVGKTS